MSLVAAYQRRIIDDELDELLGTLPAIALDEERRGAHGDGGAVPRT